MQLAKDGAADYEHFKEAWTALDRGVDANPILLRASGKFMSGHPGGAPWPANGAEYTNALGTSDW